MMHKRTLHSLLIVSFIAIFAVSAFAADEVVIQPKEGLLRCADQSTTVTANIDAPVSAVEVVLNVANYSGCGDLENLSVTWDLDAGVLTDRFIDLSQAPMIRFVAVNTSGLGSEDLAASGVIATIGFKTADCTLGEAEIAGAVWPSAPPFGPIETQFVDAGTGLIRTVAVTAGIIEMINAAPEMVEIAGGPFTLLHGATFTYQLEATDDDAGNGCETLVFDIVSGPAGMTIEPGNILTWVTDGDSTATSLLV
jgi:hypothetical protein